MLNRSSTVNLAFSGGGIRGIAHIGAFESIIKNGYRIGNICGVSAGALVGALISSGYTLEQLKSNIYNFPGEKIKTKEVNKRYPIIKDYMLYKNQHRKNSMLDFLSAVRNDSKLISNFKNDGEKRNIFSNIIKYSEQDYIIENDYLEEWVDKLLRKKGVKTFNDLRGGLINQDNPLGYRMKMTAVDVTRGKIVVLPDDLKFYDITPEKFPISKAVIMSMAVPFVFKPVKLRKRVEGIEREYYLVDGGVLDNFPVWLVGNYENVPVLGFRITESNKGLFPSPLTILKSFISLVHDIGKPKVDMSNLITENINVKDIDFLKFSLNEDEKEILYKNGIDAGNKILNKV